MEQLEHKTIKTTPFDLTYSYYLSPSFHSRLSSSVPTLLFNHGFPDDAHMWAGIVHHLLKLPYPFILTDLLGFGDSSKPTDASKYNYRQQADSLAQILDNEKVPNNVIPIGHDWGSAVSQRFYLYHRQRCTGLVLLSLAYQVPSPDPFDLKKVNEATVARFGYPQWEYWNFFTAPDAPEIMKKDLGHFWDVNNGYMPSSDPKENGHDIWMREMFCTPGAMRNYMTRSGKYEDFDVPLRYYQNGEYERKRFIERLSRDGLEGPVQYYHSLKKNTMLEDERALCKELGGKNDLRKIEVPMLYIGQTGDWVCRTDLMNDAKKENLVADLEERVVQGGHWILYEKPDEIAHIITGWMARRFPVQE
jgi:soluble epoxide hydrolase / lipid-phosphate phosphatase